MLSSVEASAEKTTVKLPLLADYKRSINSLFLPGSTLMNKSQKYFALLACSEGCIIVDCPCYMTSLCKAIDTSTYTVKCRCPIYN